MLEPGILGRLKISLIFMFSAAAPEPLVKQLELVLEVFLGNMRMLFCLHLVSVSHVSLCRRGISHLER